MISDVLSEAVAEIDRYLAEMPDVYDGDEEIVMVRDSMDRLRVRLDTPPTLPATERLAKVAARIRGESVPDWQRRGFLHAGHSAARARWAHAR